MKTNLNYATDKEKEALAIKRDDPILKKGQAVIRKSIQCRTRIASLKKKMAATTKES